MDSEKTSTVKKQRAIINRKDKQIALLIKEVKKYKDFIIKINGQTMEMINNDYHTRSSR